jgi:hypothetical protein
LNITCLLFYFTARRASEKSLIKWSKQGHQ